MSDAPAVPRLTRRTLIAAFVVSAAAASGLQAQSTGSTMQQIKQRGELRIGVTPAEPWYFKDPMSSQWSGMALRVGQQLAQDLGVKAVPVETTWANSVAALQANQIDVMFVLDPTDERRKAIDFPAEPFFYYAQGVLVRDGLAVKQWSDLDRAEVRIGVTLGTSLDKSVTEMMKNAKIERFANNDEAVAAFQAGRVDAVSQFHPALVMQHARVRKGTVLLPEPVRAIATSAGIRKDNDPAFREWLGKQFDKYYSGGTTQKFYEEYLKTRGIDVAKAPGLVKEGWNR